MARLRDVMGIVKFAQFVLVEAKVAPPRMSHLAFLRDAQRHKFHYTPKPGFLYVRSRAISSRTNDNFDTYPAEELRTSYRSFVGKPVFVNHNNDDPRRGRGVVLDAVLHENLAPDGSPDTWVEVLMEVDANRFPLLAKRILDGDIDRTSMGCNVMSSECSYCGKVAVTPDQYCDHISNQKGRRLRRRASNGGTEAVLVHEICRGLSFFENSLLVDEPADPTAIVWDVDDRGLRMGRVAAFKLADVSTTTTCNLCGTLIPRGTLSKHLDKCSAALAMLDKPVRSRTSKIAAGSKSYVVVSVRGGAEWEMHIEGCGDLNMPKYQMSTKDVISADSASEAVSIFIDPDLEDQGYTTKDVRVLPCAKSGVPVERKPLAEGVCPGTGQPISNPTRRMYLPCPVCRKTLGTGRGVWPKHKPYETKEASVAKVAIDVLDGGLDYGPTEPGPDAGTRWEGVYTEGSGYRVIVLWREHAEALAAMLSGVFKDAERAEEWAQKCRDAGALRVSVLPPKTGSKQAARNPDLFQGFLVYRVDRQWYRDSAIDPSNRALGAIEGDSEPTGHVFCYLYDADGDIIDDTFFDDVGMAQHWVESNAKTAKTADYDEVHRAHPIETLRNQTCPVCKTQNSWDGSICTVCGYVLPPKPFRAPDTDVTSRVNPDEGWFDPDAKKAEPFDPVSDRDTAMKGQKDQGDLTMASNIAAAARQRLQAQQALAAQRRGMPRSAADGTSWGGTGEVSGGAGTIQGDPVPSAEAPSETTEGAVALPDAQNVDVETPGDAGVTDVAPDATADVTDVGGEVPAPAPMDVVDVTAPVAGATDVDPAAAGDERPNINNAAEGADGTPLNASDWNTAARRSARRELENVRTAVRERIFSALRLAKLRMAVGVAEHNDELALARDIENGSLSNESIANEIKALGLVYSRQRQTAQMPTAPHQRSARRSPSMAGGSTPLQSMASAGQDDEALFEP